MLNSIIAFFFLPPPPKTMDASGRSQPGQFKAGSKQDTAPPDVDMEEAPSMSDGDVCISASTQSPHLASGAVSGGLLCFGFFFFYSASFVPLLVFLLLLIF